MSSAPPVTLFFGKFDFVASDQHPATASTLLVANSCRAKESMIRRVDCLTGSSIGAPRADGGVFIIFNY